MMTNEVPSLNGIWTKYEPDDDKSARARKVQFVSIDHAKEHPTALCKGSHGESYAVTLEGCTCVDFVKNRQTRPCKHMIALAMQCRLLNENGLTYEQETKFTTYELAAKVALASGFYNVFHKSVIPDNVYNALKYELWDWCGWVDEESAVGRDMEMDAQERELFDMPLQDFQLHIKRLIESDKI